MADEELTDLVGGDMPIRVYEFADGTVVEARTVAGEWHEWSQALEAAMSTCIGAGWSGCLPGRLTPVTIYGRVVGVACDLHASSPVLKLQGGDDG